MHVGTANKSFDTGFCNSFGIATFLLFHFSSVARRGSESLYQWLLQQSALGRVKKNNAPVEFLGCFWSWGQIFKGKCFCACWTAKANWWAGMQLCEGWFTVGQGVPCHRILGKFGLFCPAQLVKFFPDDRNVPVEQCRAAAGMNNSRGNQPWRKLATLNQIIFFFLLKFRLLLT